MMKQKYITLYSHLLKYNTRLYGWRRGRGKVKIKKKKKKKWGLPQLIALYRKNACRHDKRGERGSAISETVRGACAHRRFCSPRVMGNLVLGSNKVLQRPPPGWVGTLCERSPRLSRALMLSRWVKDGRAAAIPSPRPLWVCRPSRTSACTS